MWSLKRDGQLREVVPLRGSTTIENITKISDISLEVLVMVLCNISP